MEALTDVHWVPDHALSARETTVFLADADIASVILSCHCVLGLGKSGTLETLERATGFLLKALSDVHGSYNHALSAGNTSVLLTDADVCEDGGYKGGNSEEDVLHI